MKKIFMGVSLIGLFVGCAQDNMMELEGRVAMKGSEPHTYFSTTIGFNPAFFPAVIEVVEVK